MKHYRLHLRLLSPTCIARRPTAPGQPTETLHVLSGTVLRGGMATHWLAGRTYADLTTTGPDNEQARFQRLFLSDHVRFGNGWLVDAAANSQSWVVPQTAWTPKRGKKGWRADAGDGVYDVLVKLLRNESPDELLADTAPDDTLDRLGNPFAAQQGDDWYALNPRQRLITRTALTPIGAPSLTAGRGTTADGQLYSFSALEAGQVFVATLSGTEGVIDDLIEQCGAPNTMLTLGQGRSRGLGQVEIEHVESLSAPHRDSGTVIQDVVTFSARVSNDETWCLLPVTLLSDTIVRDRYLLPCSSGDPQWTLERYWAGAPSSMTLQAAVQSTRWIGGWDALRGIPREPQLTVQQGAVWVYRVPRTDLDAAVRWWLHQEEEGLGERRSEGFGHVYLLHPLHRGKEERIW